MPLGKKIPAHQSSIRHWPPLEPYTLPCVPSSTPIQPLELTSLSHFRAFALTVPSARSALLPDCHTTVSFSGFRTQFKYWLLRRADLDSPPSACFSAWQGSHTYAMPSVYLFLYLVTTCLPSRINWVFFFTVVALLFKTMPGLCKMLNKYIWNNEGRKVGGWGGRKQRRKEGERKSGREGEKQEEGVREGGFIPRLLVLVSFPISSSRTKLGNKSLWNPILECPSGPPLN